MATFNGTDWTFADFSGEDGYRYAENWDPFWDDVIAEMASRAAAIGAGLVALSTSSVTIGPGSKSFDAGIGKGFSAGMWVTAVDAGNSANSLTGIVTSYNSGTGVLVLSVPAGATTGSGTIAAWTLGIGGKPGMAGADGAQGAIGPVTTYWGGTAGGTANALTATTGASLTSLTRGQIVDMRIGASANAGAATLNVDSVGAKAIQKNGAALVAGDLPANTTVSFMYDGTAFQLVGGAGGEDTKASIAAASTVDIGGTSARAITITAGTGPITAWGTAPAGAHRDITFATSVTLTHNATSAILLTGGSITTMAGDTCRMESLGGGNWRMLSYQRYNGLPLGIASTQSLSATDKASNITLTNSNATASWGTGGVATGRGVSAIDGKRYWEVLINAVGSNIVTGIASAAPSLSDYFTNNAEGWGYIPSGLKANNGGASSFGAAWGAGDRLCFCYDSTTRKFWMGKIVDNAAVWGGSGDPATGANPAFTVPAGIVVFPAYSLNGTAAQLTYAFGAGQQLVFPPASFSAFT